MGDAEVKSLEVASYAPLNMVAAQNNDYMRFRMDTSQIVTQLQRLIGGKEWSTQLGVWVSVEGRKSLANDVFMNELLTILIAYVNQNTMQANIDAELAHRITLGVSEELIFLIGMRLSDFGIDESNRDLIVNLVDDIVLLTLTRAIDDGQRMHDDNSFRSFQTQRATGTVVDAKYLQSK